MKQHPNDASWGGEGHGAEAWSQRGLFAGWVRARGVQGEEGGSQVLGSAICHLEANWRQLLCVLVCSRSCNKILQPGRLKQRHLFLAVLGAWKV